MTDPFWTPEIGAAERRALIVAQLARIEEKLDRILTQNPEDRPHPHSWDGMRERIAEQAFELEVKLTEHRVLFKRIEELEAALAEIADALTLAELRDPLLAPLRQRARAALEPREKKP